MEAHAIIEDILVSFSEIIGEDYVKYKNHVYRVYHNCIALDNNPENTDKYAIAAAFHDIGIWTKNTIDYLDPSISEAFVYLRNSGRSALYAEVKEMIYWHHKITTYNELYAHTVETFRKADWIDVTIGFFTFGVSMSRIRYTQKQYPNAGFHWFLLKKIVLNLAEHPFKPLPMFKA